MITVIIDDDNKEHEIVTQLYNVGCYVIVDYDPAQQGFLDTEEKEYHKMLRKNHKFVPDKSSKL